MNIFIWDDKKSVGIDEIDNQHKRLVALLNEVYEIAATNFNRSRITGILSELHNYTMHQLSAEEEVLRQINYPFIDDHAALQESISRELDRYIDTFTHNPDGELVSLLGFLTDWLHEHITEVDRNTYFGFNRDHN